MGTAGLMFHQAVADRLGLNTTDHKCLELLHRHADATAGDVAEWLGLTTGAVTGIIDRLERAGFVRREAHPSDRRKIVIRPVCEKLPEVSCLFQSLGEELYRLAESYSEEELRVIMDYMTRSAQIFREETGRLRKDKNQNSNV
jgi:DNA-binding MarR family transcriptional regulator